MNKTRLGVDPFKSPMPKEIFKKTQTVVDNKSKQEGAVISRTVNLTMEIDHKLAMKVVELKSLARQHKPFGSISKSILLQKAAVRFLEEIEKSNGDIGKLSELLGL